MNTTPTWTGPTALPVRERARIVNDLLGKRFERLLPQLMRETGFDAWLIVCHEDNHDPVFRTMIPWQSWTPILQIVLFYDPGDGQPVERLNLSMTNMRGLMTSCDWSPESEEVRHWATSTTRPTPSASPCRVGSCRQPEWVV